MDTADNLQKFGGFIPGIRPGRRTAEFIDNILTRLTFAGSIYLGLIALLPTILISGLNVGSIPAIGTFLEGLLPGFLTQGLGVKFSIMGQNAIQDLER